MRRPNLDRIFQDVLRFGKVEKLLEKTLKELRHFTRRHLKSCKIRGKKHLCTCGTNYAKKFLRVLERADFYYFYHKFHSRNCSPFVIPSPAILING